MSPPAAAMSPRCASGIPNREVSAATTRSHDSTISKPPASAGPLTAAISGFGKSRVATPANPPLPRAMSMPRPGRDDLQVGARGEHLARAGEHDRAQVGVGLDLVERGRPSPG